MNQTNKINDYGPNLVLAHNGTSPSDHDNRDEEADHWPTLTQTDQTTTDQNSTLSIDWMSNTIMKADHDATLSLGEDHEQTLDAKNDDEPLENGHNGTTPTDYEPNEEENAVDNADHNDMAVSSTEDYDGNDSISPTNQQEKTEEALDDSKNAVDEKQQKVESDKHLDEYTWEQILAKKCPLNCSENNLQCWRLSGYRLPFICLPPNFDPNNAATKNDADKKWWHNALRWATALLWHASNAELATLALLGINTALVLCTCACVCVRRRCLRKDYY
ncbi:hypothetical protein niasHS_009327 [Heterodera schachtii]|uniref:Uncharacterized protein n=2 Tax=Heterodera TaxID=34509 RepID=A0ABD2JBP4_HETSC